MTTHDAAQTPNTPSSAQELLPRHSPLNDSEPQAGDDEPRAPLLYQHYILALYEAFTDALGVLFAWFVFLSFLVGIGAWFRLVEWPLPAPLLRAAWVYFWFSFVPSLWWGFWWGFWYLLPKSLVIVTVLIVTGLVCVVLFNICGKVWPYFHPRDAERCRADGEEKVRLGLREAVSKPTRQVPSRRG